MFSIIEAAGWPIWPLIVSSIVALALIFERAVAYSPEKVFPKDLIDDALKSTGTDLPSVEKIQALSQNSVLGSILAEALLTLKADQKPTIEELRAAMESAGKRAEHTLNRRLNALATIASSAPLLGLLGTVVGMIEIFGGQSAAAGGNPGQLAHGISIALYNTAFGLIVAIPALICWRYFKSRADAYLLDMELAAERYARHLSRKFDLK